MCLLFLAPLPPPADEFQTPPSSPPSEEEAEGTDGPVGAKSTPVEAESLQSALHSALALKQLQLPHERYLLRLSDLQVLVGKKEEVGRSGLLVGAAGGPEGEGGGGAPGKPELHLLDKFTLSVKIQRFVCMFTCMFVCTFTCMFVCTFTCMFVYTFTCRFVCMFTCMLVCMFACMLACTYDVGMYIPVSL